MTEQASQSYIHYDPKRIDYSLSEEELQNLASAGQNSWKDFCVFCFAVGIPCTINAVVEINKQVTFSPTLSFNINLVVGIVGIFLGIAFAIAWKKSKTTVSNLIEKIKNKPKVPISPSFMNVGALDQQNVVDEGDV